MNLHAVLETVPSEVFAVVARALSCTPLLGRAVFINDRIPGGFLLVERAKLFDDELAASGLVAPEMLKMLRLAPTCKVPVLYRIGSQSGVAILQRMGVGWSAP